MFAYCFPNFSFDFSNVETVVLHQPKLYVYFTSHNLESDLSFGFIFMFIVCTSLSVASFAVLFSAICTYSECALCISIVTTVGGQYIEISIFSNWLSVTSFSVTKSIVISLLFNIHTSHSHKELCGLKLYNDSCFPFLTCKVDTGKKGFVDYK